MPDPGSLRVLAFVAAFLPAAAAADWRDDLGEVRLGVVETHGAAYTRERWEPFRAFLEARLELTVSLRTFSGFAGLVGAQVGGSVDIGQHTAFSYVATAGRCGCVEPVAVPVGQGDVTGFHSIVVAPAASGIRILDDAVGKRLAVSAPDSVAGFAAPISALEEAGVSADDITIVAAADPVDAVTMILTGEADLAAAWSSLAGDPQAGYSFGALTPMVADGLMRMDEIEIIWQSPEIPFGPIAVRSSAPAELKILLLDSLLSLANEAPAIADAVMTLPHARGAFARVEPDAFDYMAGLAGN